MPTYYCPSCKVNFEEPSHAKVGVLPHAICKKCRNTSLIVPNSGNNQSALVVQTHSSNNILDVLKAFFDVNTDSGDKVLETFASYCDEKTLGLLGFVSKRYKPFAVFLLSRFIPEMAAYGSTTHNLKNVIKDHIRRDIKAQNSIRLAVDKFPFPKGKAIDQSLLGFILQNKYNIDLLLGTPDNTTISTLIKAHQKAKAFDRDDYIKKMHNKIWIIGKDGIISGSPNVSYSGLEGSNNESIIHINSPRLVNIIAQYFDFLKSPNARDSDAWHNIEDQITKYNANAHVNIALAPITNIQNFVMNRIGDAVKIVVRQYLISPGTRNDITNFLCDLKKDNNTQIDIYLDQGAYDDPATSYFVRQSAERLMKAGINVWLQQPVKILNASHEAIQHDKLILAELSDGRLVTLLGSAGFTNHVYANENAENFIYTDVKSVYNALWDHHVATTKTGVTKKLVLPSKS